MKDHVHHAHLFATEEKKFLTVLSLESRETKREVLGKEKNKGEGRVGGKRKLIRLY